MHAQVFSAAGGYIRVKETSLLLQKLRAVALSGGSPQVMHTAHAGSVAAWPPNGDPPTLFNALGSLETVAPLAIDPTTGDLVLADYHYNGGSSYSHVSRFAAAGGALTTVTPLVREGLQPLNAAAKSAMHIC
jgi:hypothetical protein